MPNHLRSLQLFTLILATLVSPARGVEPGTLDDAIVDRAVGTIVEALYELKAPKQMWEPDKWPADESSRQGGGYTALAVLALLHAGESYQNPRLSDAIEFLQRCQMQGTYAVAARCHVWAKLPPRFQSHLERDTRWLLDGFSVRAPGWDYVQDPDTRRQDNSMRHYVMLGLWEAAKRGADLDERFWRILENAYIDAQLPDGGWNYTCDESPPRGSMTAAGLTALFITQDYLHGEDYLGIGRRRASQAELAIRQGLEWMDRNFTPTEHPGHLAHFYYYLYGVERVGLASGYRTFAGHDWYRTGAAELINRLLKEEADGFALKGNLGGKARQVRKLSFALLFLSRGRSPLAVHKLQLAGAAWNNRPRDMANFTRWLTTSTEQEMLWQIIPEDNTIDEWLEAPFIYVASHEALPWAEGLDVHIGDLQATAERTLERCLAGELPPDALQQTLPRALRRLKDYLDRGGLLVAAGEGSSGRFNASVETIGAVLYPHLRWRDLPDDHWAFRVHRSIERRAPALRGLSNGVRELMILAPRDDLSRTFQADDHRRAAHWDTLANIYFHASELGARRPRLRAARSDTDTASLIPVTVIRAMHAGSWDAEPGGLAGLGRHLAMAAGLDLRVVDHPLGRLGELTAPADLVIVSGIDEHAFTAPELAAVRAYAEGGGVVLFETAGGVGDFAAAAETAVMSSLGGTVGSLADTRIITAEDLAGATRLARAGYRSFSLQRMGVRETTPRLRGLIMGGQPRILFSREDIGHALLDQPCWGVSGYSTPTARTLMTNILLHARALRAEAKAPATLPP